MLTLLDQLDKGNLWRSPGGIHPPEMKSLSNGTPIERVALASEYLVPVPLVGETCTLSVNVGDKVLKGQPLTQGTSASHLPVHAPTSGEITHIEERPSNHASLLPVLTCIIRADGQDSWCQLDAASHEELDNSQIVERIRQAGIAGMGGAAFPSHIKLSPASEVDLVIINGVECEPYITSDDRLMREHSDDILCGIGIINQLLQPKRIVIAIEDNKPEAAESLKHAINRSHLPSGSIRVTVIPTKYPSGGEKQLIQIITGKEVPSGAIPAQLGVLVHNVGTAYAIAQAVIQGKPLVERVVTVTGQSTTAPGNYWVPIGTPVDHLLNAVGFKPTTEQKVIVGGPMMGHTLGHTHVPVLKGTNCILVPSDAEIGTTPAEKACIRCGECAVACPALLLPQQLFWHSKAQEYDKAASFNLKDCIECGCCSYVCPSDIPLVEYYRIAKSALKLEAEEKRQAERAKHRFEARLQRLEDEKLAREAKAQEAAARRQSTMTGSDKNAVAEAMARIQAKKAAQAASASDPERESLILDQKLDTSDQLDKKSQVAAAVARAKAKKAAASAVETSSELNAAEPVHADDNSVDDKKAKIAAAVARAKAKKAAASAVETSSELNAAEPVHADDNSLDDKKAKVAAAVARAKAKKHMAEASQDSSGDAPLVVDVAIQADSSQAPIAQNAAPANHNETPTLSADEQKKARVAAAVAKAKAKKAALAASTEDKE